MQVRSAKWQLIALDVAQKLHQIWIQDFGIPERCLRTILSLKQPLKDQFDRFNSTPKLDIQLHWMAKFGTIFEPLKCRCRIESNPSQSEFYHQVCKCQDLHKIPPEKLEFICKQRERSQLTRELALSYVKETKKIKNVNKKMLQDEARRVRKEKMKEKLKFYEEEEDPLVVAEK